MAMPIPATSRRSDGNTSSPMVRNMVTCASQAMKIVGMHNRGAIGKSALPQHHAGGVGRQIAAALKHSGKTERQEGDGQRQDGPWRNGALEPRHKELIYIAVDASATHLYLPGLRQHIRNALGHGATREEILEVFELVSVLGIHACTEGAPILAEVLAEPPRD